MAYVEAQIRHGIAAMSCPYCGSGFTLEGDDPAPVCCLLMAEACNAVLDRIEHEERLDRAARITEGAIRNGLLN